MLLLLLACATAVPQTDACASYVACVQATDAARATTTDVLRFDAGGDCWGGPAGAELCDRACIRGLELHAARFPEQAEACTP
jgi:hypothetical protein